MVAGSGRTFGEAAIVRGREGEGLPPGLEGEPMSVHETEHGMTHEDIVPLVDRVASLLATERGVPRDQASILAHKLLHELTGDVRNDFEALVWEAAPAEAAQ